MHASLSIARKDLRQRLRDRSAILVGVVAPVVVAAVMSFAFKGAANFSFTLGVVDLDHGPAAAALLRVMGQPELRRVITVERVTSATRARSEVHDGHLGAALVIPAGFSSAIATDRPPSLSTFATASNTAAGDVTNSVAQSFVAQLNADRLAVATALATGAPADKKAALLADAAKLRIPVSARARPAAGHPLELISYYAPGMAIFFLLFTVAYTARSFFVDRAEGMIERMRAAPVRPVEILVGKALSVFVYGSVSLAVVALITSAAFGADWGTPFAAVLLGLALVLSVVCLTALVIGLARTQRQADGIGSAVVFALALLGGNFFFISTAPPLLRRLALFTPNGWALRGFTDLSTLGGGLGTVVEPILAILLFSAVVGAIAATLAKSAVTR